MKPVFLRLALSVAALAGVARACCARRRGRLASVRLGRVAGRPAPALPELACYASAVERWQRRLGLRRPGGCWVRAYALAWLLRRRGVPVELNVGVGRRRRSGGHAWLTLGGLPLLEPLDVRASYGRLAGQLPNGVRVWTPLAPSSR